MNSNDAVDTAANARERALVNLKLMRSIGTLKEHIVGAQEVIRDISGTLASSKELYDKAEKDLQNLADVTADLKEELKTLEAFADEREAANDFDDTITDGGTFNVGNNDNNNNATNDA